MSDTADEPMMYYEIQAIEERVNDASPGPWYVRHLDDDYAASLTTVSIREEAEHTQRYPAFDCGEIIAATLVQCPARYATISDQRWDENAEFIACARTDVPRLVAEVKRLKRLVGEDEDFF